MVTNSVTKYNRYSKDLNLFYPSVSYHIETSYLICAENQMTGFYMKYNTGLKWVKGGCIKYGGSGGQRVLQILQK